MASTHAPSHLPARVPSQAPALVLISAADSAHGPRLVGRRVRLWHRLLARGAQYRLDSALAAGCSPDADMLRAVRARALVGSVQRRRLVRAWEMLLDEAHGRLAPSHGRIPVRRHAIIAAEHDIREMLRLLRAPLPVPARGVAMARTLLVDGAGPVYNRAHPVDLGEAVRAATLRLDPTTELMTPHQQPRF